MTTGAPIATAIEDLHWLQRFARGLARNADDADDLVQDTLLEAWRHPPADREAPVRPWLAGVLRNRFRMRRRGEHRREDRERRADVVATQSIPDAEQAKLEVLECLLAALRKLPAEDQRIVVRRFLNDETAAEIGRDLDMQPATVRSRIHRSLQRLRQSLDRRFGDRTTWCAAVLAIPSGVAPTAATTGSKPMMSLTTKIVLATSTSGLGLAGWLATAAEPAPRPEPAAPQIAAGATPKAAATQQGPRTQWEERRTQIRAALPSPPTPVVDREAARQELARTQFRELVEACMEDAQTKQTGALTLALHEIGSPDIGTIYESVKVVHTNLDDAELLECLTQSMYGYVGEAPDEPVERQYTRTVKLGVPANDEQLSHQIVGRIVGAHIGEVGFCGTKGEGEVRGTVAVSMTMGNDGRLAAADAADSELPPAVVECIVAATKRWIFPRMEGGETFDHTFDLPIPEQSQ